MKAFTFNDNWAVKFEYGEGLCEKSRCMGRCATATITNGDDSHTVVGAATCVPQDNYCKITGRKMAFKRAVAKAWPAQHKKGLEPRDRHAAASRRGAWQVFMSHCDITPLKSRGLRQENRELRALFALQHKRIVECEQWWQEATGMHNTMPDLGELLKCLSDEIKRLKGEA